ncbi:unnamed protein product [Zymoseptoria tritici ST99CH_3D7]|uniref:glucan endo-1,6-beta-glucosidase n=1 Tax=Zymoseptoria tritici (strain ST99CH_3D7) TaxID=1276538 RepID=A0A1X7RQ27_ZYMT9|nr:unnamed protein product [Zymoseptoria tritici ST99CH_3D7]
MHIQTFLALAGSATLTCGLALQERASAAAYTTDKDLNYKNSPIGAPVSGNGSPNGRATWKLNIDDTSSGCKQTIDGFGGCVTDATVTSFNTLSSGAQSSLLKEMSHFSLLRHTIASSDLSGDPAYTYDDNGGNADPSLSGFNLGDRGNAMTTLLKSMKNLNSKIKILGSPWSAPGWMKLNKVITGTTNQNNLNDGYLDNSGPGYSQAFAQYFVKYIQALNNRGVSIDAITVQNEPLNSNAGFPTMYMFDYEQAQLVNNYVGPALRNAGIGADVWAYDHNTDHPEYPERVINGAGNYVGAAAWHCYAGTLNWTVLTDFHNKFPNKKQYMTECYTTNTTGLNWVAGFVMGPLQNWASGSIAWTLGTTDKNGPYLSAESGPCKVCRGLFTTSNGNYQLNVDYYVMAQFSKYIPVGATVLSGSGSYNFDNGGIQSVATRNPDGSRTVVIHNSFANDVYVTLTTKSGQTWSGNTPANSVTSWILP